MVLKLQVVNGPEVKFSDTKNPEVSEMGAHIQMVNSTVPPESQESNFTQQYTLEELQQLQMKDADL